MYSLSNLHDTEEFPMVRVWLDSKSQAQLHLLTSKLGRDRIAPALISIIDDINKVIEDRTADCMRSHSPILTGELRGSFNVHEVTMESLYSPGPIGVSYIPNTDHLNSRPSKGVYPTNSGLGQYLEDNTRRAGWMQTGQDEFRRLLEGNVF